MVILLVEWTIHRSVLYYFLEKIKNLLMLIPTLICWLVRRGGKSFKIDWMCLTTWQVGKGKLYLYVWNWSLILLPKILFLLRKWNHDDAKYGWLKLKKKWEPHLVISRELKSLSLQDGLWSGTIFWQNRLPDNLKWNMFLSGTTEPFLN